ncbi:MAG: hypothetical protein IJV11_10110 [Muribaculaceae bacterium]|nr:hypothetical protein [Muribaculaceae bacterium]
METTRLNQTQIHLLRMFELDSSEDSLNELKEVLYRYYSKRMDDCLDELWDSGQLNQERLDEINGMDLHQLN